MHELWTPKAVLQFLLLHKCLQTTDRRIPLFRYLVETVVRQFEALRLQLPNPFPAVAAIPNQTSTRQRMKVLGDCLTRDPGALTQTRDRMWPIGA